MLKKICCVMLAIAMLCGTGFAATEDAAPAPSYDIIYTAANPVPDIADRVRPAVVQVVSQYENWDAVTRVASIDDISYGSGSYIRKADEGEGGYILTNYHVISKGEVYKINWLSGESMEAKLVGHDEGTDIAVLRFDEAAPEGAEPIPMGDSDALRIGELAICIGNPGTGFDVLFGTVTVGIVSGLEREDVGTRNFKRGISVIQVDAAINSGNSGGALLNAKGELVGIPTLKLMYFSSSIYEGLGFCVPINTVKDFIDQIIENGVVERPRMGVTIANIDGPDEAMKKYPPIGVQIYSVDIGGPGAKAGLQMGDIITEINGIRVVDYREVLKEVDKWDAGDTMMLHIYRYYDKQGNLTGDYEEFMVGVTLEKMK